jgi:hypothetical protein
MEFNLKRNIQRGIRPILGTFGLELVRKHRSDDPKTYIPFKETIAGANLSGQSVGDYIDSKYQAPGATQETIDKMVELGVFQDKIERICEIGPGSGRYLEKTLKICKPVYYEIYETAADWAQWLVKNYEVIHQPTDGVTLSLTPSRSIDLIHAHRVFSSTTFLATSSYFLEMIRVVREGGKIVFDILDEDCMDTNTLRMWLDASIPNGLYPSFLAKGYALDIFYDHGFSLMGDFFITMKPGRTHYFVFSQ